MSSDILRHMPPYYRGVLEAEASTAAENAVFNDMEAVLRLAQDRQFVMSGDAAALAGREQELGILPSPDDTLEQRRVRILAARQAEPRYTWAALERLLDRLAGAGNYTLTLDSAACTLHICVDPVPAGLEEQLRRILPCHLVWRINEHMPHWYPMFYGVSLYGYGVYGGNEYV